MAVLPIETVPSSASGFSFPTAGIFYSTVRNGLPSGVLKISVLNVIGLLLLALVSEPVFLRARSLGGSLR